MINSISNLGCKTYYFSNCYKEIANYPGWQGDGISKGNIAERLQGKIPFTYALSQINGEFFLSYVTSELVVKHVDFSQKKDIWIHRNGWDAIGKTLEEFIQNVMGDSNGMPIPLQEEFRLN